jgi:putative FmdB family regulatory protein
MPLYQYKCSCGESKEVNHAMSGKPEVSCDCGKSMRKSLSGGSGSYIDGVTVGKYYKEDRLQKKKRAHLAVKQQERYGGENKLVPNVDGEEVGSWDEAQKLAASKGKTTDSYKDLVESEKYSHNSKGMDEKKWKELKEEAKATY